jgi:predicted O-methyltransferase YrrM
MKYLIDDIRQAWRYRNAPTPAWTADSEQYRNQHLASVPSYASDLRLHQAVSSRVQQGGLILEFGVATGRSIRHWAQMFPTHDIYGFDGFEGIYQDWNGMPAGTFAQRPPEVPANVRLVVGRFDQTLPKWCAQHPGPISLLHIDCDLYQATCDVFDNLRDRIVSGTIIVFDEYWNYPTWQQHEFRAWQQQNIPYEYIGYVHGGNYQPVAVRVL